MACSLPISFKFPITSNPAKVPRNMPVNNFMNLESILNREENFGVAWLEIDGAFKNTEKKSIMNPYTIAIIKKISKIRLPSRSNFSVISENINAARPKPAVDIPVTSPFLFGKYFTGVVSATKYPKPVPIPVRMPTPKRIAQKFPLEKPDSKYPALKNTADNTAKFRVPILVSYLPANIIVTGNTAINNPNTNCDCTDEKP